MIYTVAAINPKGEALNMHLYRPGLTGLNVKKVTGISPIGADIYSTPFASVDGGVYNGSRVPSRNIVLTIGMWPEEFPNGKLGSIEESRLKTYNYFQIKEEVELAFITDHRALAIKGYVESNELDIFSDHEEAVISVICVNPWFYTINNPELGYFGTTRRFEFPFESVEGGHEYPDLFEFGDISIDTRFIINYKGDVKTGFKISITFADSGFHNIYIYNMGTREKFTIYTEQIEKATEVGLNSGDELQISTVSGNKYAYLIRDGIPINVLSAIDKNSDWFQLTKGQNVFAFMSDYGYEHINMVVTYRDAYAGV